MLGASTLTPEFWDDMEAALIQADIGSMTASALLDELKTSARDGGWISDEPVRGALKEALTSRFPLHTPPGPEGDFPWVVLLAGVNGSGKTTTAAKLANHWKRAGFRVMLAAADTYRAAAQEQLGIWANRLEVELISGAQGSDPGAVVYAAAQAATARGVHVLIVDTSGRMHTEHNLMAELEKIARVAAKVIPGAPQCTLLVLDATTGQNAIAQAKAFQAAIPISGVVLTKLDTSARGGIAVGVQDQLGLPVSYVGMGEDIHDLHEFDAQAYVEGLLPTTSA